MNFIFDDWNIPRDMALVSFIWWLGTSSLQYAESRVGRVGISAVPACPANAQASASKSFHALVGGKVSPRELDLDSKNERT